MVDNGGNMPVLRGSWPVRRRQIRDHRAAAAPAQLPLHVVPQAAGRAFRSRARVLRSDFKWVQGEDLAKHAVVGLTRQLAHELGPFGITVNSVAPGFVRSNAASEKQWAGYGEEGQRALVERIAIRRLGTAQDIANSVVFFASELAGFVNGQVLAVDGGK